MRKIIVAGKEIKTNYGEKSAERLVSGDDIDGYELYTRNTRETNEEFLNRLISYGYTKIRFAEVSTRIKNFHDVVAYCEEKTCIND